MNKYKAKKQRCWSKHVHDSIVESQYCNWLRAEMESGRIKFYCIQHRLPLDVNGRHICDHIVDFHVILNNDVQEAHEVKGYETDVWKIKRKLFEALYPDIRYLVIRRPESKGRKVTSSGLKLMRENQLKKIRTI